MKQIKLILLGIGFFILSCHNITERLEGFTVHGIDVSHHQGSINWDSVAVQPIHFAFVKATEGEDHVDSLFAKNWNALNRVGIKRGAYHFFSPKAAPISQAENFINQVELQSGDLAPVIDVEVIGNNTTQELIEKLKIMLEEIEKHYGVAPIIYSNQKFYLKHLSSFTKKYPTWIARYHSLAPNISYEAPWDFWQYGNRGKVAGIKGDVDLNVFRGEYVELDIFSIPKDPLFSAID